MLKSRSLFSVLFVAIFVMGVMLSAPQKSYSADDMQLQPVIATVDGKAITKDELYATMLQFYPQQVQDTLNRLVNEVLVDNAAATAKVAATDQEIKVRAEELGVTGEVGAGLKRIVKTSILAEKMIIAEYKITVTPAEVKTFFDTNKDKLGQPEQVHLRQIFVQSEADANDTLMALNAGADFAKMAQMKSLDTATKEKGGDIGFFSKGMLVPEIEKVVFEMKSGEISPVINTSAGFHIIKVEEKVVMKEAKFDKEMKANLEKLIKNQKVQDKLGEWLDNLKKKAEIK